MMEYSVFKNVVTLRVKDYLPPVFRDFKVELSSINKVNRRRDTMSVVPWFDDCMVAAPTIYLEDEYAKYKKSEDLEAVLKDIGAIILNYTELRRSIEETGDFINMKDKIVPALINAEKNKRLLESTPHRTMLDLAVVFRFVTESEDGYSSAIITEDILEEMNLTLEQVEAIAYENTKLSSPAEVISLTPEFSILTNRRRLLGAAAVLEKEKLREIADKVGGNFYLLPISVHEMLIIPTGMQPAESLKKMLIHGNREMAQPEEFLSNSLYMFDCEKDEVIIA